MTMATVGCGDEDPAAPAAPTVHADLVAVWRVDNVTCDGEPWDIGHGVFQLTIAVDATYRYENFGNDGTRRYFENGHTVVYTYSRRG